MKPSQLRWKWLLFSLLAALVLFIALIPWLIGDTTRFGDRVAAELSAWTGGEIKFTGPVRVSFLPDVSVRGRIELEDSKRLPAVQSLAAREAKISLDLVDLLRGRITIDALRLLKPHVTLRDSATATATPADAQTLFTALLGGAPVRVLHVRKGRIMLPGKRGGAIRDIYAHLDAGKETGAVSGFGSFAYKDTTVRYSLESGSVSTTGGAESFPITLTLTSRPLRARLSGTASNVTGFTIDGDMQAEIDDGRRFLKWIGIRIPDGDSLKGFSAAGPAHLSGSTLTFDDGTFTLDGNKAVGLLALTVGEPHPRVEGTLAFDRLVLDPYLGGAKPSAGKQPLPNSAAPFPFNQPLLQFIDADLRISAAAIDAGALKLGRGGFTITAKQGSVASEVGELELCGGSADGRLNVDLAQEKKKIDLVANVANIAFDTCLEPLALGLQIRGTGNLKTELASEGADFSQLTGNLAGTLKLEAKDGAVPVDFVRLATGSTPISAEGWSRDALTAFDQLDADCQLGSGHIWCQSLSMQTPRGTIAGSGDIDLTEQTLDWNLTVANPITTARASQPMQGEAPKVSIRGSLAQPTIRRADRPTLGEGSLQTNPAGPQVSPR
jgi:AsmA protein